MCLMIKRRGTSGGVKNISEEDCRAGFMPVRQLFMHKVPERKYAAKAASIRRGGNSIVFFRFWLPSSAQNVIM